MIKKLQKFIDYFDMFDYPLRDTELQGMCGFSGELFTENISTLIEQGSIELEDPYIYKKGKHWTVSQRIEDEQFFNSNRKRIYLSAWFISHMPFVRGVLLSGQASKNLLGKYDDYDYFIIVKDRYIWVCRTIAAILRKCLSFNYHNVFFKYFCCNYFISDRSLTIPDKNIFTALEIAYAKPLFKSECYDRLKRSNTWTAEFVSPDFQPPANGIKEVRYRIPLLQFLLELPIIIISKLIFMNKLDLYLQRWHKDHWLREGIVNDENDFDQRGNDQVIKPNSTRRQDKFMEILEEPDTHKCRLRTKIALGNVLAKKKTDIVLTHAFFMENTTNEKRLMKPYFPLGPVQVAAYLKQENKEVSFFDTTFEPDYHGFIEYLQREQIQLIGIYVLEVTRKYAVEMIDIARHNGVGVIVGGPDASADPEFYVKNGANIAVIGEGEEVLIDIIDAINTGNTDIYDIPGTCSLKGRAPARELMKDVTKIPDPARELVDMEKYLSSWKGKHGYTSVHLITSRGCPFHCNWCQKSVFGASFRQRPVHRVVEEIISIKEKYNPSQLWFTDDILGLNKKWFAELHKELTERKIKIPFECLSRADIVDKTLLQQFKDIGCYRIWYGTESGSQKVLDNMNKQLDLKDVAVATKLTQDIGIEAGFFIQIGYPGEKISDIELTIDLIRKMKPDLCGMALSYPIFDTDFYHQVKDQLLSNRFQYREENKNVITFEAPYSNFFYNITIRLLMREFRRTKNPDTQGVTDNIKYNILRNVFNLYKRVYNHKNKPFGGDPVLSPKIGHV